VEALRQREPSRAQQKHGVQQHGGAHRQAEVRLVRAYVA
jgi:hypothetical protein